MNTKTVNKVATEAKKVIRHIPPRAVEAGTALIIGKALKGSKRGTHLMASVGALVAAHYIYEWAKNSSE